MYPFALEHLIHFLHAEIPLDTDAVTVLLAVEPLAIVGTLHIGFTRCGDLAVLDKLAPAAAFVVLPFALVSFAVGPSVSSVAVLFTVVPLSFIFFAVRENLLAVAFEFAVLKAALICFAVWEGISSLGHPIVLPFAVK